MENTINELKNKANERLTELKKKSTPDILKYIYDMRKEYIGNIRKSLLLIK